MNRAMIFDVSKQQINILLVLFGAFLLVFIKFRIISEGKK